MVERLFFDVTSWAPSAAEFELGLLSPDDSVSLLLECAGEKATNVTGGHAKPFSDILYKAVALCGHLPLVISIAAGILEQQFSGIVDESFIELLSTDDKQVLREGEHGDELGGLDAHGRRCVQQQWQRLIDWHQRAGCRAWPGVRKGDC